MQFGLVLPRGADLSVPADFDYLEPDIERLLEPQLPNDKHDVPPLPKTPIRALHSLIPASLPITGPHADLSALRLHVQRACERAAQLGVRVITLSSPDALGFPEGYDPKQAKSQVLDFLRTALPFFARHEIMLVAGVNPPDRCNVMTTLPEVLQYVWQIDHPWFQCLLDTRLLGSGNITPEQFNDGLPWIRHVYVGGSVPGLSTVFAALKRAKYDDLISMTETHSDLSESLRSVRQTWSAV